MLKDTVSCIITTHQKSPKKIIETMMNQTYPAKQLIIVASGIDIQKYKKEFPLCSFIDVPNRKDWGHSKRAIGLAFSEGEYVCFCNQDDEYDIKFLERMIKAFKSTNNQADFVYCAWRDRDINFKIAKAVLEYRGMTSGNFVVKSDIAKSTGWNGRGYSADWDFIKAIIDKKGSAIFIPEPLMTHN